MGSLPDRCCPEGFHGHPPGAGHHRPEDPAYPARREAGSRASRGSVPPDQEGRQHPPPLGPQPKDTDSKFRLILIESRIHRLARYYKKAKVLAPNWKYESSTASTLVA